MIKKAVSSYAPRQGTKPAAAMMALIDGPMTTRQLADAIECSPDAVHATLSKCLTEKLILRIKDHTGLAYFALPGRDSLPETSTTTISPKAPAGDSAQPDDDDQEEEPLEEYVEPTFRCGLFNDGMFIVCLGETQIDLTVEQTREMIRYLERMSLPEPVQEEVPA